ncbi:MAG: GAF domain-containing protein [Chloroflexi bacterium]|nr:GAF domain-containing protein [Chloroflexota bacterium]
MASLGKLTLQKRIGLLIFSALIVGLGLFSWVGFQSVNESVDRTLDERLTIARIIASDLDQTLVHLLAHLQNAASTTQGLPSTKDFDTLAASLGETLTDVGVSTQNIILVDREGRILQAASGASVVIGINMSQFREVSETLKTGRPTISGSVRSPLANSSVILATAPIRDETGDVIGGLAGLISIEQWGASVFSQPVTVGNTGYAEIVDGNGIVLARTRPGAPPKMLEQSDHPGRFADLISRGEATVRTCHRCHEVANEKQQSGRDVLAFAPLAKASWGVAIRQAEEEALAPTRQLERRLLIFGLIILLGASLLLWMMMQGIVTPLKALTSATKRVATGDFKAVVPSQREDEIGQLGDAFYSMTQQLAKSREELLLRNEELSALNAIAVTVSQSLDLEDILENAMRKVLDFTRTSTGCLFLRDADSNRLDKFSCTGIAGIFGCQEAGSDTVDCACHQVLHTGETLMVKDASQCPMLGNETITKEGIHQFISVPLKTKDRTLGIMNIACSNERSFTQNDFRILNSIGYHVGLAIENSILYKDTKQKEKLRGQLLSKVINAQEDERKRIARELHDEYGQMLAGLMINLESLENMPPPAETQFKEKLKNTKSLVARALQEMRRLTLDLRPSTLDDLGLVTTVRSYAQNHLEPAGIRLDFASMGMSKRLTPAVETALFRIIQEAIHNITKYAEAHNVRILLEVKGNRVTAVVEDDGKGFDVETTFSTKVGTSSLGLLGIQERATLLGGSFSIKSQAGQGTRLVVEIPLPDAEPSHLKSGKV